MARKKTKKRLSSQEAFENLSLLEEIDPNDPFRIGIVQESHLVDDEEEFPHMKRVTSQNVRDLTDIAARSYDSILSYFQGLIEKDETEWKSPQVQKGLEAIMDIVGGSAQNLNILCGGKEQEKLSLPEYEALEAYYATKILPRLQGKGEIESIWEAGWIENSHSLTLDIEELGAQDFEAITRDRVYELFSIKDAKGNPFFDPEVIRKIRVFREVDGSFDITAEEDPFLHMHAFIDKDLHGAAMQILSICSESVRRFYKAKIRKKEPECIRMLSYALMALMLAGNDKNLLEHKPVKSSHDYFLDFLFFLEKALSHPEYMKWMAYPDSQESKAKILIDLSQDLAFAFFTRKDATRQEMIGFIKRLIRLGEKEKSKEGGIALFMKEREALDVFLSHFPNGPVMKIIEGIRGQNKEERIFFSPIKQGNHPSYCYTLNQGKKEISVLRVPSPTMQTSITKAVVLPEFHAFLYGLIGRKKKLLMIHLQDKNSWVEEARCKAIEIQTKQIEYAEHFFLLTLPKETPFYHQIREFSEMDDAEQFMDQFREEIFLPEEYGFTFPKADKQSSRYLERILPEIHELFFDGRPSLTRKERLDFIEIAYLFLMIESIALCEVNYVAFTSKDSIDKGPPEALMLYYFCMLLSGKKAEESDYNLFRWIVYASALKIRERATDTRDLYRIFSVLALLEDRKNDHKKWQKLLTRKFSIS